MSYYRRSSRRRSSTVPASQIRHVLTESPYSKSLKLVRSELFGFDYGTFDRFARFYADKNGYGPGQYLRKTIHAWRSGRTGMAGTTVSRILECVPPFLSKPKQFELLAYYIPSIIQQQQSTIDAKGLRVSQLTELYKTMSRSIMEKEYHLDWFVKEVFPPDELEEFLCVLKYTMLDCLRQSHSHIQSDLGAIPAYIAGIDGCITVTYRIALLSCPLELDTHSLCHRAHQNQPRVGSLKPATRCSRRYHQSAFVSTGGLAARSLSR